MPIYFHSLADGGPLSKGRAPRPGALLRGRCVCCDLQGGPRLQHQRHGTAWPAPSTVGGGTSRVRGTVGFDRWETQADGQAPRKPRQDALTLTLPEDQRNLPGAVISCGWRPGRDVQTHGVGTGTAGAQAEPGKGRRRHRPVGGAGLGGEA